MFPTNQRTGLGMTSPEGKHSPCNMIQLHKNDLAAMFILQSTESAEIVWAGWISIKVEIQHKSIKIRALRGMVRSAMEQTDVFFTKYNFISCGVTVEWWPQKYFLNLCSVKTR